MRGSGPTKVIGEGDRDLALSGISSMYFPSRQICTVGLRIEDGNIAMQAQEAVSKYPRRIPGWCERGHCTYTRTLGLTIQRSGESMYKRCLEQGME